MLVVFYLCNADCETYSEQNVIIDRQLYQQKSRSLRDTFHLLGLPIEHMIDVIKRGIKHLQCQT